MPQISGTLLQGKPIISVAVSEAVPMIAGVEPQQSPAWFHTREYRALLDTGADITCVLPHVVKESLLVSRGLIPMTNGVGTFDHMSYLINVGVWCEKHVDIEGELDIERTLYQIPGPTVAAEIRANSWFDLIIGMDIISQHSLSFGRGGKFTFELS